MRLRDPDLARPSTPLAWCVRGLALLALLAVAGRAEAAPLLLVSDERRVSSSTEFCTNDFDCQVVSKQGLPPTAFDTWEGDASTTDFGAQQLSVAGPDELTASGSIFRGNTGVAPPAGLPAGSSPTGSGSALSWYLIRFEVTDPTQITLSGDLAVDGTIGEFSQNAYVGYRLAFDDGTAFGGAAVVTGGLDAGDIGMDTLSFGHDLLLGPGAYLLSTAAGTSDSGGSASYDVRLTVPEPGTGLPLSLALCAWLVRRRKRRGSAPGARSRPAAAHQR